MKRTDKKTPFQAKLDTLNADLAFFQGRAAQDTDGCGHELTVAALQASIANLLAVGAEKYNAQHAPAQTASSPDLDAAQAVRFFRQQRKATRR